MNARHVPALLALALLAACGDDGTGGTGGHATSSHSSSTGPLPAQPEPQSEPLEERDTDRPRPDQPGEAILFRRLSLQDENGNIPQDGLTRGIAHAKAMAANSLAAASDTARKTGASAKAIGMGPVAAGFAAKITLTIWR